jgi:hypothetical protein
VAPRYGFPAAADEALLEDALSPGTRERRYETLEELEAYREPCEGPARAASPHGSA